MPYGGHPHESLDVNGTDFLSVTLVVVDKTDIRNVVNFASKQNVDSPVSNPSARVDMRLFAAALRVMSAPLRASRVEC